MKRTTAPELEASIARQVHASADQAPGDLKECLGEYRAKQASTVCKLAIESIAKNGVNSKKTTKSKDADPPANQKRTSKYSNIGQTLPNDVEKFLSVKAEGDGGDPQQLSASLSSLPKYTGLAGKVEGGDPGFLRANTVAGVAVSNSHRQSTHKQRETVVKVCHKRRDNKDAAAMEETSFHELTAAGGGGAAAAEALLRVADSAVLMEKLGKSPTLIKEVTAMLCGHSMSSIQTFDLHNLSHGDNLIIMESDEDGEEEEEEFYGDHLEIDSDVSDQEEDGAIDLDIDSEVDLDDDKGKKTPAMNKKKKRGGKNKDGSDNNRKKSPEAGKGAKNGSRGRAKGPKDAKTKRSNKPRKPTQEDEDFFKHWAADHFEDDPFAATSGDPFADESPSQPAQAPFGRSATAPIPTRKYDSGPGLRKMTTRDQVLVRKNTSQGGGRGRLGRRAGRGNTFEMVAAAPGGPEVNSGDNQDDTTTSGDLGAKLNNLKKSCLERGPSVSTVIANKIRNDAGLLEQFLDMVKEDESIAVDLASTQGTALAMHGFDNEHLANRNNRTRRDRRGGAGSVATSGRRRSSIAGSEIKPGMYRSIVSGDSVVSGGSGATEEAARPRRNRLSISEVGVTRAPVEAAPQAQAEPEQKSSLDRRRGRHAIHAMEESTRAKIVAGGKH